MRLKALYTKIGEYREVQIKDINKMIKCKMNDVFTVFSISMYVLLLFAVEYARSRE